MKNGEETWKRPKLWDHEKNALIDAIAVLQSVKDYGVNVQPNTISTLKTMLGLKGEFPQYMNDAIAEMVDKYPEHGKE